MDGSDLLPLVGVLIGALLSGFVQVLLARGQSRRDQYAWRRERRFSIYDDMLDVLNRAVHELAGAQKSQVARDNIDAALTRMETQVLVYGSATMRDRVSTFMETWLTYSRTPPAGSYDSHLDVMETVTWDCQRQVRTEASMDSMEAPSSGG